MPYVLGKVKRTVSGDAVADVADVEGALSQAQVDTRAQLRVDALESNAPAALDTLNELAAALGDDANYAATITTALAGKASTTALDGKAATDLSNVAEDSVTPDMLDADSSAKKSNFRSRIGAGASGFSGSYNDLSDQPTILSQAQVDTRAQLRVDALEGNAPAALDTLNELAAALGDDANYAATITTALAGKASTTALDGKAATDLSNVAEDSVTPDMLDADSSAKKSNFRSRIGAGASGFSGSYNDLSDQPTILSQAQVDTRAQLRVDALEGNAPAALDTLNELAAALGDDANYAATITTALAGKASTTAVAGKAEKTLSNVSQNTTVAGRVKALLELLSGDSRLDGSAIKNVIPPNQPQSAYLDQGTVVEGTWYEVLDYTSGGGFFHSVVAATIGTVAGIEVRITVDGTVSSLGYDDNAVDAQPFGNSSVSFARKYDALIRFSTSLKVEVRRPTAPGAPAALDSKVIYSTDI